MFRTGQRTDHTASVEAAPKPEILPQAAAEPAPAIEPVIPIIPDGPVVSRSPAASDTTIGTGVTLDGTLRFSGTMRMSGGTFSGKITAGDKLIVEEGATLSALATCAAIEIRGKATGSLTANESVDLRAPARVSADVSSPSLAIEKGVHFEGTVRMRKRKG